MESGNRVKPPVLSANSGCAGPDRPESGGVWVDLVIAIAQEQNVDE